MMLQCALVTYGQRRSDLPRLPGVVAGAAVVHVRAGDGRDKPDATAEAPPWFMCGCRGAVPNVGCKRGAPSGRRLPLALGEGSQVRRAPVWEPCARSALVVPG